MISTYKALRKIYPAADILIGVEDIELARLLIPDGNFIHYKYPFKAEVVVLGGGGQFFCFNNIKQKRKNLLNKISDFFYKQTSYKSAVMRIVLRYLGAHDNLFFSHKVAAYCIGMGPFDGHGAGYFRAKKILPALDYISVRDGTSAELYRNFCPRKPVEIFTDPSFNKASWAPEIPRARLDQENGYVTLIVRDWPLDERGREFTRAVFEAGKLLSARGEKVRYAMLYEQRDFHLRSRAGDKAEWMVWSVSNGQTIGEFINDLCRTSKAIISTRAHGVMLPAVFGVPSIAIEIEPKLREIHSMLPHGTLLVSEPTADAILSAYESYVDRIDDLAGGVTSDCEGLAKVAIEAERQLIQWLKKN